MPGHSIFQILSWQFYREDRLDVVFQEKIPDNVLIPTPSFRIDNLVNPSSPRVFLQSRDAQATVSWDPIVSEDLSFAAIPNSVYDAFFEKL
jgi:hypothetical protein